MQSKPLSTLCVVMLAAGCVWPPPADPGPDRGAILREYTLVWHPPELWWNPAEQALKGVLRLSNLRPNTDNQSDWHSLGDFQVSVLYSGRGSLVSDQTVSVSYHASPNLDEYRYKVAPETTLKFNLSVPLNPEKVRDLESFDVGVGLMTGASGGRTMSATVGMGCLGVEGTQIVKKPMKACKGIVARRILFDVYGDNSTDTIEAPLPEEWDTWMEIDEELKPVRDFLADPSRWNESYYPNRPWVRG